MRGKRATEITRARLRRMPLPQPDDRGDKDARGRVLAVGGSAQVPGAILLAGVAALRAGAGKLQLATVKSAAAALGVAVPEALVIGVRETRAGEMSGKGGARALRDASAETDALLIGPGMMNERAAHAMLRALARRLRADATLVLDAAAITALADDDEVLLSLQGRAVLTPHAGEMATLLAVDKQVVESAPAIHAIEAAARFGAVVALKGAESWIAEPDGTLYHYAGGSVGLATSGSGDTLAGIVAGLAAGGASAVEAAVWGVYVHGEAGNRLARRLGRVGYLARELLDEVPHILQAPGRSGSRRTGH